jgi:integrase
VVFDRLPDILSDLAVDPESAKVGIGRFESVQDLLAWYESRTDSARYLTKGRRSAISCIINRHLAPRLGDYPVSEMRHEQVDDSLIRPMLQKYSVAYIRQVFDVLRLAFKQADKLRQIEHNPIGSFKFSDFIDTSIKPRDSRLRTNQLPALFQTIASAPDETRVLCTFMLMHGTRIGETKTLRWDWINWADRTIDLPAQVTKTREAHRIPMTDIAAALLKRYRAAQEFSGYTGVYLFPNGRGRHIASATASAMVRRISGGDWTAHDLRKLARTCWADQGVDYMVSERLLNHKLSKLDQAYIHTYVETQKRTALEQYHNWLRKIGLNAQLTEIV